MSSEETVAVNFDLELFDHRQEDGEESFRVRVIGSQTIQDAERVTVPADFRRRLDRVRRGEATGEALIEFGRAVAGLLLPAGVRALFVAAVAGLRDGHRLRLRIRPESPPLAELTWELAYVPSADTPLDELGTEGFLALDGRISFVRFETIKARSPILSPLGSDESVRIGALLADPGTADCPDLDVEEEGRRLRSGLDGVENVDVDVRGGEISDLEALLANDPHVFHFAGHGEFVEEMGEERGSIVGRGSLILEAGPGRAVSLPAGRLARNLKGHGVRLVVLSACEGGRRDASRSWSGIAPALVRGSVPAVVAMQFTIGDDSAIRFTEAFYRALGSGRPIDAAVTAGRQAIANAPGGESGRDWASPVLYSRAERSILFPVRRGPSKRLVTNALLLAVALVLAGTWFYQHYYFRLLETRPARIIAGLGGLVAILTLLLSPVLPVLRGLRDRLRALFEERLAHPAATPIVAAGAAGVAAAYLLTSSVYVIAGGTPGPSAVMVTRGSDTVYRELKLEKATGSTGRVEFPGRPGEYVLRVISPPVYDTVVERSYRLWPTVHLSAARFDSLALPVVRLVPAWKIFPYLPARGRETRDTVDMEIELGETTVTFGGLYQGSVLVGPDETYLKRVLAGQDDDATRQSLQQYQYWEALKEAKETYLAGWVSDTAWAVPPLQVGDTFAVRVRVRSSGRLMAVDTVVAGALTSPIRPVFLDTLSSSENDP